MLAATQPLIDKAADHISNGHTDDETTTPKG